MLQKLIPIPFPKITHFQWRTSPRRQNFVASIFHVRESSNIINIDGISFCWKGDRRSDNIGHVAGDALQDRMLQRTSSV